MSESERDRWRERKRDETRGRKGNISDTHFQIAITMPSSVISLTLLLVTVDRPRCEILSPLGATGIY